MTKVLLERLKIFGLFLTTTLIVLDNNPLSLSFFLLITLILIGLNGNIRNLENRLSMLFYFVIFIFVFQAIFNHTVDIKSRMIISFISVLKISIITLIVFLYTSITTPATILEALSFLPKNLRIMLCMAISLLPVIIDEIKKIQMVQKVRQNKKKFINPLNNFLPIIIPLIHRTLKRSEQISLIMAARGYE